MKPRSGLLYLYAPFYKHHQLLIIVLAPTVSKKQVLHFSAIVRWPYTTHPTPAGMIELQQRAG